MTTNPGQSVEQLIELDIDQLYERIGRELIPGYREAVPTGFSAFYMAGKTWLQQKRESLADIVCRDEHVRALMRQKNLDRIILAGAIVDVLLSSGWDVAPATVAVLLVKEGIDSLCGDRLSQNEESA